MNVKIQYLDPLVSDENPLSWDEYPNATSCEILANGVLRVENNGEVMHFSPSYWHKVTTKA
ncbi:hypothetical protein IU485_08765 [Nocardia cyriacigeorgica]|uniref:hypothetical protein n=1 Tax=Nocardia cyriacigeorgica TaxID=135487 RepID=UPI001892E9A0|nr:hypothetical protein [Nocardia cyriacigeorgica]MBF6081445.1 hypothetical protein [Nocardia cyriacigeorgica]MBF6090892.1 hypothetical protein [Nocardia cyriacigeorgica]